MSVELVVDVKGVSKRFGSTIAISSIDMQIQRGEIRGFLGPNGSGKTTFLRILCGLLHPDGGTGSCLGFNIRTQSAEIKRNIGYMTQRFSFYEDLSIEENLDFVCRMYEVNNRRDAVQHSLERLGLESRRKQLAGALSGGWKQRLALAACMIHNPALLLLDEPTAGVDPKARREFWEEIHALSEEGITVLISTHYMDEAERCHKLAYLAYGNLLSQGSVDEVIKKAALSVFLVHSTRPGGLVRELRTLPGVQEVTAFGNTLHVVGQNAALIHDSLTKDNRARYTFERIDSSLEDVFISLMSQSRDNIQ